jgi:hypothetical protein
VLENAKRVLADRGVLVIQDFARPDVQDPRKLDHQVSWFGQPYSYRRRRPGHARPVRARVAQTGR